jgi:hypothetical protein
LARCHNGGCGWRKNKAATNGYWKKIQKILWHPIKFWYFFLSWSLDSKRIKNQLQLTKRVPIKTRRAWGDWLCGLGKGVWTCWPNNENQSIFSYVRLKIDCKSIE